ncbi:GntR family transcriptional regulator [Liquorilactobacillus vini]|uniref:GntR family transcriptional regulator n=1 Tax=Liquorilactobacillus vini TaxID=238015 RepID=UPI00030FCF7C|nr:GntR family transcriptional regulator [Liquorilactobacillus vini]
MSSTISATQKIYQDLKNRIIRGEISPTAILTERKLAEEFKVSKAPVRESLRQLTSEGFLIVYPRKGYVQNILTEKDYHDIQQVRIPLEQLSVSLVIANCSAAEIKNGLTFKKHDEKNPYLSENTQFHLGIAKLTDNQYLYDVLKSLLAAASRAFILKNGKRNITGTDLHQEIIQAMLTKNVALAKQIIKNDISQQL